MSQHRNDVKITSRTFQSILSPNTQSLPEQAVIDLTVATIALKYTQSNSVCYAKSGMVIGLGAGQQSRIHCTRLAGDKADIWWMRQHPRVLSLKWKKGTKRPEKSNAIDLLVTGQIPEGGQEKEQFEGVFEEVPAPFTKEERKEWMSQLTDVACSSDAFVSWRTLFILYIGFIPNHLLMSTSFRHIVPLLRQCLPCCSIRSKIPCSTNRIRQ